MSLPTEPYSRIERYLAKLAGQDVDIPDRPITRIECYLDYLVNNGGGSGGGFIPAPNAGAHNAIFRGHSIGTEFTSDQSAAITGGTFEDMYIGDYWTIDDIVYRIAGFDLFLKVGNPEITTHHAVIVTDTALYDARINETDNVSTGYYGSELKTIGLDTALATVESAFGAGHILEHNELFSTNINTSGVPVHWSTYKTKIDIMNGCQTLGTEAWGAYAQNAINIGQAYTQFPLFALSPDAIRTRQAYWLRDVCSYNSMMVVTISGAPDRRAASTVVGIRPYFLIA